MLALAVMACGRDAPEDGVRATAAAREPDPIVLRIPRGGGVARAALYPVLDSIVWSTAGVPGLDRVLGFDPEAGLLAVVTTAGSPAHLDLRLGSTAVSTRTRLESLASANGSDIFGIDAEGTVVRFNPAGRWSLAPRAPARSVYPQPDGAVIIAAPVGARTQLWRVHPPDDRVRDSASLPQVDRSFGTQLGDRLYFTTDTAVVAVTARTLEPVRSVRTGARIISGIATPSGDRLYLASEGEARLRVISRFVDGDAEEIPLPGAASDLRMDPLGRYVLARVAGADSAWIVAVGNARVVATVATRWAEDLPTVMVDGSVATLGARDVSFINPLTGTRTLAVPGGAADFWISFFWNGFRPRAVGLDVPVTFPAEELPAESIVDPGAASGDRSASLAPDTASDGAAVPGFTISFAALLAPERAQAVADSIFAGGARARVIAAPTGTAGVTVYRVVLGPYATREAAEAIANSTQRPYWIFQGAP